MSRHNNKQVDLSRTIRLSGLSSGAKLELVQLSKSTGVVTVALQLPSSTVKSDGKTRLTDKFPSTTTLWLLLRKFEAGVAGSSSQYNFTQRAQASTETGAGRLYYEQPVLNIMGRELATFTDLQKTLAQLGLNSGNVLVKLDFRLSQSPLEEAMAQIQSYFDTIDPGLASPTSRHVSAVPNPEAARELSETTSSSSQSARAAPAMPSQPEPQSDAMAGPSKPRPPPVSPQSTRSEQIQEPQRQPTARADIFADLAAAAEAAGGAVTGDLPPLPADPGVSSQPRAQPEWLEDEDVQMQDAIADSLRPTTNTSTPLDTMPQSPPQTTTVGAHQVSVYRPPTTTQQIAYNEQDYVPTVEHAQAHQKLLQQSSQNKRLPTDAEIAAKEQEQAEALKQIRKIDIRIRFPDLTFVDSSFTQSDTAAHLYTVVRECLDPTLQHESFILRNPGIRGKDELIPDDHQKRLIADLKLKGKILVVFAWNDSKASPTARLRRDVLKPDLRQQAQEYRPPPPPNVPDEAADGSSTGASVNLARKADTSGRADEGGKSKVPKWLMKGLGKK